MIIKIAKSNAKKFKCSKVYNDILEILNFLYLAHK